MKKVGIICFTDFDKEPRVIRTISALKTIYKLTIFSNGKVYFDSNSIQVLNNNIDYFYSPKNVLDKLKALYNRIFKGIKFGSNPYFERQYWSTERREILNILKKDKCDVYIGHGIYTLPLLAELSNASKVVFNAHEYYPAEFEENEKWRIYTKPYYEWILKTYLAKVNLVYSVTQSIGHRYVNEFKVKSVEINNAGTYRKLKPTANSGKIKLIHHGAALKGRRIEEMCELMSLLPSNYELNLMLVKSDEAYFNELHLSYGKHPQINFIEPVSFSEIPVFINQFDIGLYILRPNNFNEENCLPNKFFEFVQARLCIAVTPNQEMRELVSKYKLGVVSSDYTQESMSKAILSMDRDKIYEHKLNVDSIAYDLSSEQSEKVIANEIEKLVI